MEEAVLGFVEINFVLAIELLLVLLCIYMCGRKPEKNRKKEEEKYQ